MGSKTFQPDANPESTTFDGAAYRSGVNETFATIRAGAGVNAFQQDSASTWEVRLDASGTSNQYALMARAFTLFDLSSVSTGTTITRAVLSVYGNGKVGGLGTSGFDLHVAAGNPASNTAIAFADFTAISRTSFGSVTYANFSTSGYNDIELNANGIAGITKAGITKFSLQSGWDLNNSFGGSWSSTAATLLRAESADSSGKEPKLTIYYEDGGSAMFFAGGVTIA